MSEKREANERVEERPAAPDLVIPQRTVKRRVLVEVLIKGDIAFVSRRDGEDLRETIAVDAAHVKRRMLPGETHAVFWADVSDHAVELVVRAPSSAWSARRAR